MIRAHRMPVGALMLMTLWVFMLSVASPVLARSDENATIVNVIGSSPIRGDNMPASREEAIADSLVAAVSRVLTDVLPQETVAGNFQVLTQEVLERHDQFVRNYRVLTESTYSNTYRVMVEATISIRQLKAAIKKAGIHLGDIPSATSQVEVVVEGTGGQMASFVKFRGALSTMSGVDSVQLKEMQPDAAVLSVAYQGSARTLGDALMQQSFDTFGIDIFEVRSNSIRLRLVARGPDETMPSGTR